MIIRKAKLKDVDQITRYGIDLIKYHHKLDPYFAPSKNATLVYKKFFNTCIYSKNRQLLVADDQGKIVGYAIGELLGRPPVFKVRKIGHISDVLVIDEYQKQGIAKKFIAELFEWFKDKKIKHIEITVHSKNTIGQKAWVKYGFKDYMIKKRKDL